MIVYPSFGYLWSARNPTYVLSIKQVHKSLVESNVELKRDRLGDLRKIVGLVGKIMDENCIMKSM